MKIVKKELVNDDEVSDDHFFGTLELVKTVGQTKAPCEGYEFAMPLIFRARFLAVSYIPLYFKGY